MTVCIAYFPMLSFWSATGIKYPHMEWLVYSMLIIIFYIMLIIYNVNHFQRFKKKIQIFEIELIKDKKDEQLKGIIDTEFYNELTEKITKFKKRV